MSLSLWITFSIIGILDFFVHYKKICKKEQRVYFVLFIGYQLLFVLTWLGWLPQNFAKIIKIW